MSSLTNYNVAIVVALDLAGGFAKNYEIPWKNEPYAKEDMKRFQQLTKGNAVVMGRHTYEEILVMKGARKKVDVAENTDIITVPLLLPNRTSYVLSRNPDFNPIGATKKPELIKVLQDEDAQRKMIFILGGEKLFIESMPYVKNIFITIVKNYFDCDKFFPLQALKDFKIKTGQQTDNLDFMHYERKY